MPYTVFLHAPLESLEQLAAKLRERIKKENLSPLVSILQYPIKTIDHGQNPIADQDGRPWVSVINPDNVELYQVPNQILKKRFLFTEAGEMCIEAMRLIKADIYRALP